MRLTAESALFVPFSHMDRYEWESLRHQFIPSAAMAMDGQGHLLNESRYKPFLNCYWRDFHPFFPIIHYSDLALAPPPPLLALMMVTIGAMISSSPAPSIAFYKSCVGFFTTVSLGSNLLFPGQVEKKVSYYIRSSTKKLRWILHYRICRRLSCWRPFPSTYQGKQGVRAWPPLPGFKLFTPAYVSI